MEHLPPKDRSAAVYLFGEEDELHAPHLPDVEIAQGLREAPIVTCDSPLARSPGHRARIEVID